ncbi:peroxisomal membrane protein 11B-like [Watersipora subatra]|uniref:peroxisomal membrane protein 11B-like n=1 Tax=Watersipora subatra TaxID=2589382 RepID=UPI00355BCCFA
MSNFPKKAIAFGNTVSGRDKLCRLLQYSFRGLSDLLDRLDSSEYAVLVKKFKRLDAGISTARKLMRIGKSLEMLYAAKDAFYIENLVIQTCVALSRISSACFLFLDHIIWLRRVKAIKIDITPVSRLSNQFWLLSLVMNLIRNAHDWYRIQQYHTQKQATAKPTDFVPETLPTILDTAKNAFDILIPLNGLQYAKVPGVVQGATGALSSIIGILTIWNNHLKLQNK